MNPERTHHEDFSIRISLRLDFFSLDEHLTANELSHAFRRRSDGRKNGCRHSEGLLSEMYEPDRVLGTSGLTTVSAEL